MKNFSQEVINIDGKEYTLYLNREGIVAWETYTKASDNVNEMRETAKILNETLEIHNGDNPFEKSGASKLLEAEDESRVMYKKLYWIMLYTYQKLDYEIVDPLFETACKEYGYEQIVALAIQMIQDANTNMVGTQELKKLTALRPKNN